MLIRHTKTMALGVVMAVGFVGVLIIIFSHAFGGGRNGLEYSDDLFNKLAKGSSYFIPELTDSLKKVQNTDLAGTTIKMENADAASRASKLLGYAKAGVQIKGVEHHHQRRS